MSSKAVFDFETSYRLLLARKNRPGMPPPPALDEIWRLRILAAAEKLTGLGIKLNDSIEDAELIADIAYAWDEARDSISALDEKMRKRIRDRWLKGDDENA